MQLHEWLARIEGARTTPTLTRPSIAARSGTSAGPSAGFGGALDAHLAASTTRLKARPASDTRGAGDAARAKSVAPASSAASQTQETRYVVQRGDTLWGLGVRRFRVDPGQLARDNGIANPDQIQPGQVLVVRKQIDSSAQPVVASWYGPGFDQRPMANGAPYDRHAATIAHKTLPLGTRVELRNPETGETVRATVTDRGPYVDGRDVDLSYGLARQLGVYEPGVANLVMRVLG